MKESLVIRAIVDFLEARKIVYLRFHPAKPFNDRKTGTLRFSRVRPSQIGAPDLIVFPKDNPPRLLAIEAKSDNGRQTPEQKRWQGVIEALGGAYMIARGPDEVMRVLDHQSE